MFGASSGGGLFGAAPASGGAFSAASSSGGLFGAAPSGGAGGLFGAAPSSGGAGGLFGAAPSSGGAGGLFGAAPSSGGAGGLFGAAPASGGALGAASSSGGLFGAAPSSGGAGGLFGAAPASGGALGPSSSGALFGAAPSSGGAGGLFGAAPASGGAFGAASSSGAASSGGGTALGMGAPTAQEAQLTCMELARRMEDLYPVLGRAAGDRQSAVQAAQSGAMRPSAGNFLAFSYSFCANPQVLAQANNPQAFDPVKHVDPTKWLQALQANPDPNSCYPEALVGLPALEQRLLQQQKGCEDLSTALEEVRAGMGNLKDHLQAQSWQKLEECRQRQQKLQRQLLQVVVALERRALQTGAARRGPQEEAQLEGRLAKLEEACCAPGGARARLEELSVQLRQLVQLPGGPSALLAGDECKLALGEGARGSQSADSAETAVLKVTAQQGELLELLSEDLARRRRDTAQLEMALGRGTLEALGRGPMDFSQAGQIGARSGLGIGLPGISSSGYPGYPGRRQYP
ncbi:unnamed protein product [Effrenium voratum]|uniref:Nucleoporin Nup54 alpha-helical domain-containing protein n=1 Tax=Effrenium voratum TaxID=2562239 RepID=A0AA36JJL4_9DINO|nr:unnamed protein product [Effrenium voratum]